MELETFDNNGDPADIADKRAILVYRVDYDAAVDLLRWAYGRVAMLGIGKMETALKMDEIKLLIEQHQSYRSFANDGEVK
jgi:hypothetical protein